jgi:hypothetical protein
VRVVTQDIGGGLVLSDRYAEDILVPFWRRARPARPVRRDSARASPGGHGRADQWHDVEIGSRVRMDRRGPRHLRARLRRSSCGASSCPSHLGQRARAVSSAQLRGDADRRLHQPRARHPGGGAAARRRCS